MMVLVPTTAFGPSRVRPLCHDPSARWSALRRGALWRSAGQWAAFVTDGAGRRRWSTQPHDGAERCTVVDRLAVKLGSRAPLRLAQVRAMPGWKLVVLGNHDFTRKGLPADTGCDLTSMTLVITGDPPLLVTHMAMTDVPDGTVACADTCPTRISAGGAVLRHLRRAHGVPTATCTY